MGTFSNCVIAKFTFIKNYFSQGVMVELVSKDLNNLEAILHVYAGGLIFMN